MKYDLKAMVFDPDSDSATAIDGVFFGWDETPEGADYWVKYRHNPHQEGRDKIAAMLKQWEGEPFIIDEPTRPAIGVLHKHDGSDESPVPVGTDATTWTLYEGIDRGIESTCSQWDTVTAYLVHSYPPETKQVTGTVTYTNGEPDFKTWKETE